ncbi:uncharacterized protein JN550_008604 [Neoarthrinium moseri]|uniref:uncharacterized protein n=1 Tax=Neoarthrinium moseri TaxID=1658444 RepID=UPI001FDBB394|nr:uncharacterized protein JN550_008604 [Neoarthrinium moseri]KAI1865058.1 hypothetical protein JN550_008604 [Neoarthrinium moseri]
MAMVEFETKAKRLAEHMELLLSRIGGSADTHSTRGLLSFFGATVRQAEELYRKLQSEETALAAARHSQSEATEELAQRQIDLSLAEGKQAEESVRLSGWHRAVLSDQQSVQASQALLLNQWRDLLMVRGQGEKANIDMVMAKLRSLELGSEACLGLIAGRQDLEYEGQLAVKNEEIDRLSRELNRLQGRYDEKCSSCEDLRTEIGKMSAEAKSLHTQLKAQAGSIDALQKRAAKVDRLQGGLQERTTQLASVQSQLVDQINLTDNLQADLDEAMNREHEASKVAARVPDLERRLKTTLHVSKEWSLMVAEAEHHEASLAAQVQDLETQLEASRCKVAALELSLEQSRQSLARQTDDLKYFRDQADRLSDNVLENEKATQVVLEKHIDHVDRLRAEHETEIERLNLQNETRLKSETEATTLECEAELVSEIEKLGRKFETELASKMQILDQQYRDELARETEALHDELRAERSSEIQALKREHEGTLALELETLRRQHAAELIANPTPPRSANADVASWADEVGKLTTRLLHCRPIVVDNSIGRHNAAVEIYVRTYLDRDGKRAEGNLAGFSIGAKSGRWYCLESVLEYGVRSPRSEVGHDEEECGIHGNAERCLQIKAADGQPGAVHCRVRHSPAEATSPPTSIMDEDGGL